MCLKLSDRPATIAARLHCNSPGFAMSADRNLLFGILPAAECEVE
jgi:hypothetical protein